MKPSPVQLLQSSIEKIAVEINRAFDTSNNANLQNEDLSIEVMEGFEAIPDYWNEREVLPAPGIASRTFLVTLGIRTDTSETSTGPYLFEIVCSGIVACMPEKVQDLEADEAARQYGLAMIYGAMREQLLTVTSRMMHGPRLLPTVSFMQAPRRASQLDIRPEAAIGELIKGDNLKPALNSH